MDKKNFFSKRNLDAMVDDGKATSAQARKLSLLSIGVGHALGIFSATLDINRKNRRARAKLYLDQAKDVTEAKDKKLDKLTSDMSAMVSKLNQSMSMISNAMDTSQASTLGKKIANEINKAKEGLSNAIKMIDKEL